MAKLHVRHMVGRTRLGRADERLFRFEFPERPGALMQFLETLGGRFNISLFHYRNHGADFGRVLARSRCPTRELADLRAFLDVLGYPCAPEDGQPRLPALPGRQRLLTPGRRLSGRRTARDESFET